jgi:adenylosuccinate lyase
MREDAYRIVQGNAMRAWQEGLNFRELVLNDPEITGKVSRQEIEYAFDLERQLRNVDKIFRRVFGDDFEKPRQAKKKSSAAKGKKR